MDHWTIGQDDPQALVAHLEKLRSAAGQPFLVCFDYFDTVVTREVEPEQTKIMASNLLSVLLNGTFSGAELYRCRQQLELEMTNHNAEHHGELDFKLDDFAARFWSALQEQTEPHRWQKNGIQNRVDFVLALQHIEVAVEQAVQKPCPEVVAVIRALKQRGFSLFLVSDFYLPELFFDAMLKNVGVFDHFDKVYVSSAHGKGKGSGRLYQTMLQENGCTPDQMVMIGDNPHADISMARQQGLAAIQIHRPPQGRCDARLGRRKKGRAPESTALFDAVPFGSQPFAEMGCSLWLFIHRLFLALRQQRVDHVFFLSKEGEFLRHLFDLYQTILYGQTVIASHYLLASRKATFLASLRDLEQEGFLRLFAHYRDISIRDFLQSLNFDEDSIHRLCSGLSIDCDERIPDLQSHSAFTALVRTETFMAVYEQRRNEQAAHFTEYLNSFGVDYRNQGLHLVDVGWKGSIQDNIFHILGGGVAVHGYYIGSLNATERCDGNNKQGLLFDNFQGKSPYFHVYNNNRSLYEMMLGASHGSADCYLRQDQYQAMPSHPPWDVYDRVPTDRGDLLILTLDLPEEHELFEDVIKPLQELMHDSFSSLTKAWLLGDCLIPAEDWFARRHARMVFTPSKEEIDFFEKLYHLENFGIFEYTRFAANNLISMRQRWRNLLQLLGDPTLLETGIWPPIILKRLGLARLGFLDGWRRQHKAFH